MNFCRQAITWGLAATWAMFGFDAARSGTNTAETTIGPANVATLELAWTAPIRFDLRCSPVAADGVVYDTTGGGGGQPVTASAYDLATGALIWTTDYSVPSPTNGAASCIASPALGGGLLFVTDYYGFVGALDTHSGQVIWSTHLPFGIQGALTYKDGVLYAADTYAEAVAFDALTGTVLWRTGPLGNGMTINSSPAVAGDVVLIGQYGSCFNGACGGVYALDKATGAVLRHAGNTAVNFSSPAVANGVFYVAIEGGNLQARDLTSGQLLWEGLIGTGSGGNNGTPVVSGGRVFVGGYDGKLYAFDEGCGSGGSLCAPAWTAHLGPNAIYATPAVANGLVYIVADDWTWMAQVFAVATDCASGGGACAPLWSAPLTYQTTALGINTSSPIVVDGTVLVNGHDAAGAARLLAFRHRQSPSATTVSSSANPSTFGDAVAFTAVVSGTMGTPTGTVQFVVDGVNLGAPVAVSGGMATSPSIATLGVGPHAVIAQYSGDSGFFASTGSLAQVVQPPPVVNHAPDCGGAVPSVSVLWPPSHRLVPITISGVTDPDGDRALRISVTAIFQDEPIDGIADGDTAPDGAGLETSTAYVRAERAGSSKVPGNGRVYHIAFIADDGKGAACTGDVAVSVPHDQSRRPIVDDGARYNSVTGARR